MPHPWHAHDESPAEPGTVPRGGLSLPTGLRAVFAAALVAWPATSAVAAIDQARAAEVFAEAAVLCGRDGGTLWHHSLCGPIVLVDWSDGSAVANVADGGGVLAPFGRVFVGTLPPDVIVSNTPIEWAGKRWTELLWPLPDDPAHRHVTISHELFHRAQIELGMIQHDGGNLHLDTLEGRILMQLEWHALAQALSAPDASARDAAVSDALLFRHRRYGLFPQAQAEERALELNEGVAEYTGVRVGLPTARERTAYAQRDLEAFVQVPTFVRSFAYAGGPAWGLLLDRADPAWRDELARGMKRTNPPGLDELLQSALELPEPAAETAGAREAFYDPTMKLTADWGVLTVEQGVLLDKAMTGAAVTLGGAPDHLHGPGWHLALKQGFIIAPGERAGDFVVRAQDSTP